MTQRKTDAYETARPRGHTGGEAVTFLRDRALVTRSRAPYRQDSVRWRAGAPAAVTVAGW
jgi:hypothetical protein